MRELQQRENLEEMLLQTSRSQWEIIEALRLITATILQKKYKLKEIWKTLFEKGNKTKWEKTKYSFKALNIKNEMKIKNMWYNLFT